MEIINGYLSRLVQAVWKDALVYCIDDGNGETWIVKHNGTKTGLGASFHEAKQAVHALVRAGHCKGVSVRCEDEGN